MKLWILITLFTVSMVTFSGCGVKPIPKKEVVVDTSLPKVTLTQYGVIPDMNAIAFEWDAIEDPRVKGIYIYKRLADDKVTKDDFYKAIDNRFTTHFLDENIQPKTKYIYYFKTFSKEAQSSPTQVISVESLDVLNSVSWIYARSDMPRSAKIIWRPHPNYRVKAYLIYRKSLDEKSYKEIAIVSGRLSAEYIDTNLEDNKEYQYRIKVITYDDIISSSSDVVNITTRALPEKIENIQASNNLANSIKVTWSKSNSKYFHLYYVYRANSEDGSYRLVATLHNNQFVDAIEKDGKEYFYRVTAVDIDSLESKYNTKPAIGISLTKPKEPRYVKAKLLNNTIEVHWENSDARVQKYKIVRIEQRNWFQKVSKEFINVIDEKFVDKSVQKGFKYRYEIYGIDKHEIISLPSLSNEILIPLPEEIKQESVESSATPKKI